MRSTHHHQNTAVAKRRSLYRSAGLDDTQSTDAFLEALVVNATVTKRSYPQVVWNSLPISQQLSCVTLVSTASYLVTQGALSSCQLLCIQALMAVVGAALAALCELAPWRPGTHQHDDGATDASQAASLQKGGPHRGRARGGGAPPSGGLPTGHGSSSPRSTLQGSMLRGSDAVAGEEPAAMLQQSSTARMRSGHTGEQGFDVRGCERAPGQQGMGAARSHIPSGSTPQGRKTAGASAAIMPLGQPNQPEEGHGELECVLGLGSAAVTACSPGCDSGASLPHPAQAADPASRQLQGCLRRQRPQAGDEANGKHGSSGPASHEQGGVSLVEVQESTGRRAQWGPCPLLSCSEPQGGATGSAGVPRQRETPPGPLQAMPSQHQRHTSPWAGGAGGCPSPGPPFPGGALHSLQCAPQGSLPGAPAAEPRRPTADALRGALVAAAVVGGVALLSPVYATLAQSISTDTVVLLAVLLLAAHMFLWDYRFDGGVGRRATRVSLGCAILAVVLGASRRATPLAAFSQVTLALQTYVLFPQLRHRLQRAWPWASPLLALLLQSVAVRLLLRCSILLTASFVCAGLFLTLICPMWLVRLGKFKAQINGPWDEAVPKLSKNVSMRMAAHPS